MCDRVYALWERETHNLVAEYDNRHDALALVLRGIERNGPEDVASLVLDLDDDQGQVTTIAAGEALAAFAQDERHSAPLLG